MNILLFIGVVVAKTDCSGVSEFTIRHVRCEVIIAAGKEKCFQCTQYRVVLSAMVRRVNRSDDKTSGRTDPSSHTNYRQDLCWKWRGEVQKSC